jgi:protein AATF/BFR2
MAAKVKGQLLKDIAALTSFGGGGGANGEEDVYDDGTSALGHGQGEEERNGSGGGGGSGTWRIEEGGEGLGGAAVSRSRLRMERAMDFGEEEARYRGKKVSRRALLADDGDEDEEEDDDEEEEESGEEDEDEEGLSGSGSEEDEDLSSGSGSGSDDDDTDGDGHHDEEEEPTLEEEMEQLRKDKGGMALLLKRSRDEQRQKAEQAREQRDMWNKLLEVRILLQRLLGMGNRFPRGEAYEQYVDLDESGETQEGFSNVASGLRGVLVNLVGMRAEHAAALQQEDPAEAAQRRKRQRVQHAAFVSGKTGLGSGGDPWVASQGDYGVCREHWREVVDAAHQRATLSWAVSKKFKVVNSGLWGQVEAATKGGRALKRSHLTRAQTKAAGLFTAGAAPEEEGEEKEDEEEGEGEGEGEVDLEAFDDSELYQQLLRDYIQAVGPGGNLDPAAVAAMGRSLSRKSKKKKVDTKASKGRKLRYAVHPKLEHFMFPVPVGEVGMDVDRLFASLPGRKGRGGVPVAAPVEEE